MTEDYEKLESRIWLFLSIENQSRDRVLKTLVDEGIGEDVANKLIDKVETRLKKEGQILNNKRKQKRIFNLLFSGAIMLAGVAATLFLFSSGWIAALPIGLALGGGAAFFKGLFEIIDI